MNLLIVSCVGDVHAIAVGAAVSSLGHRVVLWDSPNLSQDTVSSVSISDLESERSVGGSKFDGDFFDLVWLRRRTYPEVPAGIHPDDRAFAYSENYEYYNGLWASCSGKTLWLHEAGLATMGENKIHQLTLARRAGLSIPETLISNDSVVIEKFLSDVYSSGDEVIYKTFRSKTWVEGDKAKVKHTSVVKPGMLAARSLASAVPGIYQRRLLKKFELRVNIFGDSTIAVAINSQANEQGRLDWRSLFDLRGYLTPFKLPAEIENRCKSLMKLMGLRMACIDMIVDHDDKYHFVELNQQGQFLWIEESCGKIKVLEAFVRFIVGLAGSPVCEKEITLSDTVVSQTFKSLSDEFQTRNFAMA